MLAIHSKDVYRQEFVMYIICIHYSGAVHVTLFTLLRPAHIKSGSWQQGQKRLGRRFITGLFNLNISELRLIPIQPAKDDFGSVFKSWLGAIAPRGT